MGVGRSSGDRAIPAGRSGAGVTAFKRRWVWVLEVDIDDSLENSLPDSDLRLYMATYIPLKRNGKLVASLYI